MMCLFGGEIKWIENFGEKMRWKTFLSMFGWVRRKENKLWSPGIFSPSPPKYFIPKIKRKLKGENGAT